MPSSPPLALPEVPLDIPPTCQDSGSVTCAAVYDWTHNEFLAHAAEWAIGKPLTILGLVLLAWVLRWVTHRVIDRVVRRAETGVLLDRLHPGRTFGREPSGAPKGTRDARAARDAEKSGDSGDARDPRDTTPAGRMQTDPAREPSRASRRVQRAKSLGSLGKSLATGLIYGMFFVMILAQIGVNIAPIVASAGVVGLALGFGAQSLVKDFLSGIALTLEDQYGVGDSIDLGDVSGTVEAISLRVTRLRDVDGTVWYVRNGEILRVGNQSQNWARTVLDVSVAYSANLSRVRQVLRDVSHELWEDPRFRGVIIEEPEVWGVQSMSPDGIVVRVTLKTAPMEQWHVAREMRERVKDRFEEEGIEMPVAQRLMWPRPAEEEQP